MVYLCSSSGLLIVQLDNDPTLHNKPLEYSYPLQQELTSTNVNVAIAVLGYEFDAKERIDFQVDYLLPTSMLTALRFRARVNDSSSGWKYLKFNFLATYS